MATWQEDIAANLAFIRADSGRKDSRTAARSDRELQGMFNWVRDFAVDHEECEGDEFGLHWSPVYSDPQERLVMRAHNVRLDEAKTMISEMGWRK